MILRPSTLETEMPTTLIYCNYLADPEKKPFINITGGDTVYRIKNELGATIEIPIEAVARSIMASHRVVTKEGEFQAFTDNKLLFNRMMSQKQSEIEAQAQNEKRRTHGRTFSRASGSWGKRRSND
jgi:hypothetical protein